MEKRTPSTNKTILVRRKYPAVALKKETLPMPNIIQKYCPSEAKLVFANNIQPITTAMSVNV
ncbi:MAG: hypothetical protein ACLRZ6_02805 [Lachnospiraceae bacterium]